MCVSREGWREGGLSGALPRARDLKVPTLGHTKLLAMRVPGPNPRYPLVAFGSRDLEIVVEEAAHHRNPRELRATRRQGPVSVGAERGDMKRLPKRQKHEQQSIDASNKNV